MDFEIRRDRKPQGRRKLRVERAEYFRLVDQGYSNKEASRLVGVHERTGREWRNGRTDPNRFRAPARPERAPAAVSGPSRYLSEDERIHIADRLRELDLESNYELVRRLDPYVKAAATSRTELAGAVRTSLAAHLPQLVPHADEVIEFLAQYYGVED
nr:helix-turn-helix domain-containing protein [Kitasatospora sp. K002]